MANASAGTGTDTLILKVNEDAYAGDAQFTVAIDGRSIGGNFTTTARHASGAIDTITLKGEFAAGLHTASIAFINDAYGGTASTDRNFYLASATYNGTTVANAAHDYYSAGSYVLSLNDTTALTTTTPPTTTPPTTTPPTTAPTITTTIGSGLDTFLLKLSEDAYQGDAQYTVAVDGKQVGGTQTAHALHGNGASELLAVKADLAPGTHTITTTFLQDAWGGSAATDRNLYLESITYNGTAVANAAHTFMVAEASSSSVIDTTAATTTTPPPTTPPPTTPPPTTTSVTTTIGTGSDTLTLRLSEDYYQGDAQFIVRIDGKQIGGIQTAHALHGTGTPDTLIVKADLAPGSHSFDIHFTNDAWGGTAALDRNLYLDSATYNGTTLANVAQDIQSGRIDGHGSFTDNTAVAVAPPSTTPTTGTHPTDINIINRGQSNSYYFDLFEGIDDLAVQVAAATGATVHVLGGENQTEFGGTRFIDWDTDGEQATLLNFLKGQTADIRDNPTITLWMHNEYDQGNPNLTQAQWVGEVQTDAGLVRSALGQTAATTPYLFVPIRYPYGTNFAPIGDGMAQLDADPQFNARVTYDAMSLDILMNGGPEAGNNGSHMSEADAHMIAAKLVDEMVAIYNQDIA